MADIIDLSGESPPKQKQQQQRYFDLSRDDTENTKPQDVSAAVVGRNKISMRQLMTKKRRRCVVISTNASELAVKHSGRNEQKASSGKASTTGRPYKRNKRCGVEYVVTPQLEKDVDKRNDRCLDGKTADTALQLQNSFDHESARPQELEEESRRAALALSKKLDAENKYLLAQRLKEEVCS